MFWLQFLVFAVGCYSLAAAFYFAAFFSFSSKKISKAMVLLLGEQVVTALCTLVFTINSLCNTVRGVDKDLWNSIPAEHALILRFVIFTMMSASTTVLSVEVKRILLENDV